MGIELIGAAFCVGGTLLLAAMWMSNRGGDIVSHRDTTYTTRERAERFDTTPRRTM